MGKCLPLWGKVAEALTEAGWGVSLPLHPVSGWPGKGCPSSVTFGDSFPLWGSL
mgnify:CR=1 FL=1